MNCECIRIIDEKLKAQNLKLSDANFAMQWPECSIRFLIQTQWLDKKKSRKGKTNSPPPLFAAHCPICGKKAGKQAKIQKAILSEP